MASVHPFSALLPAAGLESQVSADTHTDDLKKQRDAVLNNPYTYLNVIKPYLRFNEEKDPPRHYPYARTALNELIARKALISDPEQAFYLYEQTDPKSRLNSMGLICTVPVSDYNEGRIHKHEKTITEKEQQLILHIEMSGVIGEPVLMTHRESEEVSGLLAALKTKLSPFIDFVDEGGRTHRLSRISRPDDILRVQQVYASAGNLYIADGHHRSAACAGYFNHKHENGNYLVCIIPPGQLKIDSFFRAFKAKETFQLDAFLAKLGNAFSIQPENGPVQPARSCEFGLLLGGHWYRIGLKNPQEGKDAVARLDVSVLEETVFSKILDIHDSKTDERLTFIKGGTPLGEIEAEHRAGVYDAVFTVRPCTIRQVFDVADAQLSMPPKSTYIEPKLRTGLVIQQVGD